MDVPFSEQTIYQRLGNYGLPCRVPEPTERQRKCKHGYRETVWVEEFDDYLEETRYVEATKWVSWEEDIPNTHLFQCTHCKYTRRY